MREMAVKRISFFLEISMLYEIYSEFIKPLILSKITAIMLSDEKKYFLEAIFVTAL